MKNNYIQYNIFLKELLKPYKIALKLNRNPSFIYRLLYKYSKHNGTFNAKYYLQQKNKLRYIAIQKIKIKRFLKNLNSIS